MAADVQMIFMRRAKDNMYILTFHIFQLFPDSPLTLVAAHRHPQLNRLCTQDRQIHLRMFVTARNLFPSIGTNVRTMNNFNYKPIRSGR